MKILQDYHQKKKESVNKIDFSMLDIFCNIDEKLSDKTFIDSFQFFNEKLEIQFFHKIDSSKRI